MTQVSPPIDPRYDRLFHLLPQVVQDTDAYAGYPLRALLQVMGEQLTCVEDDVARLYENAFVETCDEWVLPYLAELVGRQPVPAIPVPAADDSARGRARARAAYPRAAFARTLHDRRRKGVLLQLETLAQELAGWPARVVEFRSRIAVAWSARFPDRLAGRTVSLREGDRLDRANGPFADLPRRPDLRRIASTRTVGRGNLNAVGLFVWRLRVNTIQAGLAFEYQPAPPPTPHGRRRHEHHASDYRLERYTLDPLGLDRPLFTLAQHPPNPTQPAGELEVPAAIRLRAFRDRPDRYYGPSKSLDLWRTDPQQHATADTEVSKQPVRIDQIQVHDLEHWEHSLPADHDAIADLSCWEGAVVDPTRGRVLYRRKKSDHHTALWARYHTAFSADIGGGGYLREALNSKVDATWFVGGAKPKLAAVTNDRWFAHLREALLHWDHTGKQEKGKPQVKPRRIAIEIHDDARHHIGHEDRELKTILHAGDYLEIRAADRRRPVLRHAGHHADDLAWTLRTELPDAAAATPPTVVIDGLTLARTPLRFEGCFHEVHIRHTTLYAPDQNGALEMDSFDGCLGIESSIVVGTIHVRPEPMPEMCDTRSHRRVVPEDLPNVTSAPARVLITDSILDGSATDENSALAGWPGDRPERAAGDLVGGHPPGHVAATILRTTIFGDVNVHALDLAEDTIFAGRLRVTDTARGCIRYCTLAGENLRMPPRHACQLAPVVPRFSSIEFGRPAYAQLASDCPTAITRGATDESEMGAFHDLYQPYREALLRAGLAESAPADADIELNFVN
jgi:hypothetical protein